MNELKISLSEHEPIKIRLDKQNFKPQTEELTATENGTYTPSEGKYFDAVNVNVTSEKAPYWNTNGSMYYEDMVQPDTVTSGAPNAFENATKLKSFVFSPNVTNVNLVYCFRKCSNLRSVILPPNATGELGIGMFQNSGIEEIDIPLGITALNIGVFNGCKSLFRVNLGNVESIASDVFRSTDSLTTIHLPSTLTKVVNTAFRYCYYLENVTLGEGFLASLNLSWSALYSTQTIVAMLNALGTVPSGETRTLTLGATNLAKLTDEQKEIATNKGWTLA